MNPTLATRLSTLTFGEMQQFRNLAALPLLSDQAEGPVYLTLGEAMAAGTLQITEVSSGGSVPELQVTNAGDLSVLLLDGEELAGAKQNRVLNTAILLGAHSKTVLPVSCTEQGRWAYTSAAFEESGVVSTPHLRGLTKRAVLASLREGRGHRGNQAEVWSAVAAYAADTATASPTHAMRDVYTHAEPKLEGYLDAFPCQPQQKGVLIFLAGQPIALDLLSRAASYALLHPKLIKSYALEAMLSRETPPSDPSLPAAQQFLEAAKLCEERRHPAVGCGEELHYSAPLLVGSALLYECCVIHTAFFAAPDAAANVPPIASFRRRRAFRGQREGE